MRLMGIDPGVSTGIVVWDSNLDIMFHKTIAGKSPILDILNWARLCNKIIMESIPAMGSPKQSQRFGIIQAELVGKYDLNYLSPSEWKPLAKVEKWSDKTLLSKHELDAYCMARYYYKYKINWRSKI